MFQDNNKLSKMTMIMHWLVGFGMIALLAIGWYMATYEVYPLYHWHKSFGILIMLFVVMRVLWRMKEGWLKPVSHMSAVEALIGKLVHWTLLIATILFPISGMLMSGAGGYGLKLFNIELLAANVDPITNKTVALNKDLAGFGHEMHEILMWVLAVTVVLHVLAVFKHHFILKDRTLKRMLGR